MSKGGLVNFKMTVLFGVFLASLNLVAWQKDGVPIAAGLGDQTEPKVVVPEGKDYFYVVYTDLKGSGFTDDKIYCAKVDSKTGNYLWSSPVLACQSDSGMWQHAVVGTPSGNVIIAFLDGRLGYGKYRLYVSKIGPARNWEWGPKAVPVCTVDNAADRPQLCLDGSGEGCYVTWTDYRPGDLWVYLAKITKEGEKAFETPICSIPSPRSNPFIMPSGEGILIFWGGWENGTKGVYANRLLKDEFLWGERGKLILPYSSLLQQPNYRQDLFPYPYAVATSSGGAYVFPAEFYETGVQRVDSLGNLFFDSKPQIGTPYLLTSTNDGVVVAYPQPSGVSGSFQRVVGVKIDSSGNLPWGEILTIWGSTIEDTTSYNVPSASLISDYNKGCITAIGGWQLKEENDLIIVHTDSSGHNIGEPVMVCGAPGYQQNPVIVQEPSSKGYLVVWEDGRNGNIDLYAQYIDSTGQVGISEPDRSWEIPNASLFSVEPNPFSKVIKISSEYLVASSEGITFKIYDVAGKLVKSFSLAPHSSLLTTVTIWDGRADTGEPTPPGVYFCRLETKNYQATKKLIKIK